MSWKSASVLPIWQENRFVRAEYYMPDVCKVFGMVGSAEFVPIAEDTGQISSVEYYALERVVSKLRSRAEAYPVLSNTEPNQ